MQAEAYEAFSKSIEAIVEDKQSLAQAVNDAKRQLGRVQTQAKSMDREADSARAQRDQALDALKAAEDRIALTSQVTNMCWPGCMCCMQLCIRSGDQGVLGLRSVMVMLLTPLLSW